MNPSKELVSASSVPLVLAILRKGDSYGYEIIKTVRDFSGDTWEWSEGMLYPVLHKLERLGWITSYWQQASGRRRKYYHLETAGVEALKDQLEQWNLVQNVLSLAWEAGEEK